MNKLFFLLVLNLILLTDVTKLRAQGDDALYTFPIAVQAYTYRNSFPNGLEATLDTIQSLGVTEMEAGDLYGKTPAEFKALTDARGIQIPSIYVDYNRIKNDPNEVILTAKALGATYVMVAWIPHDGNNFNIEDARKAAQDFNKVGKILDENGLIFCYHIHGYEFKPYQDGTLFDYIAENTNPDHVSFELDLLWAVHGGADPVDLLKKYGERWKLVHLKDLKKGVQGDHTGYTPTDNDVALGTGQIDVPAIIKEAKKAGIKHYFIEDESDRIRSQVPQSIAYLKSLKK